MDPPQPQPQQGDLNWRLSAHPITLICFLGFRIGALLMYLFGVLFIKDLYVLLDIYTRLGNPHTNVEQYPRLHPDPPAPLRGFLLSQKHRRSSLGWSPVVERGERHIGRLAHGLRIVRPQHPHHRRDG